MLFVIEIVDGHKLAKYRRIWCWQSGWYERQGTMENISVKHMQEEGHLHSVSNHSIVNRTISIRRFLLLSICAQTQQAQ